MLSWFGGINVYIGLDYVCTMFVALEESCRITMQILCMLGILVDLCANIVCIKNPAKTLCMS